jgi:hypothetical protein
VVTNGMVYVSGGFTSASGVPANGVAAWNGSGWSALGAGLTGVAGSGSTFVNALAFIGTNLYAGGNFTNAGGVPAAGVARWNGTSWSALGSGLYFGVFNQSGTALALAAQGNDLFVGGSITAAGSKPASFIGHWNDQMNYYPPPHPMLSRPTWPGGGKFQFRYSGTSGQSYILQGSTNLSSWVPLTTNTSPIYDFTDTNAQSFPRRFYRAVLGP